MLFRSGRGKSLIWGTVNPAIASQQLTVNAGSITLNGTTTVNGTISATGLSGTNTGDQNIFKNIVVSGQNTVTANSTNGNLTLVGSGVTITTDNTTNTVTLTASAGGSGNVTGASLTDGNVVVGNGTTSIKVTGVNIDASNNISTTGNVSAVNLVGTGYASITRNLAANTSTDGAVLDSVGPASSGNQIYSPRLRMRGYGWKTDATAASQPIDAFWELKPVQGTANPTRLFTGSWAVNGGAYSPFFVIDEKWTSVGIGGATFTDSFNVAVGYDATTPFYSSVAIGKGASSVQNSVAVGRSANAAASGSIALGLDATTTATGQIVIGSNPFTRITNMFLGGGVTDTGATDATINPSGGSGTNNVGANLTLAGGRSTGNSTPGSVLVKVGTAGSSGTTAQTLSTVATFNSTATTLAGNLSASGTLSGSNFSGSSSGANTGDQSIFKNVAVSGQNTVVANSTTGTLTLVEGSGMTITTDNTTNSITLAATGGGSGNVTGSSLTSNKIILGNGTTSIKASGVDIDASNNIVTLGSITASNLSGTNTGDQTISLTGDVTGSGTGAIVWIY